MSRICSAVPVDHRIANAVFREMPEDEDEDEEEDDEMKKAMKKKAMVIRNEDGSSVNSLMGSAQADFVVGGRNSMTLPRSCGGSHFSRFENPAGM